MKVDLEDANGGAANGWSPRRPHAASSSVDANLSARRPIPNLP